MEDAKPCKHSQCMQRKIDTDKDGCIYDEIQNKIDDAYEICSSNGSPSFLQETMLQLESAADTLDCERQLDEDDEGDEDEDETIKDALKMSNYTIAQSIGALKVVQDSLRSMGGNDAMVGWIGAEIMLLRDRMKQNSDVLNREGWI